MIALDRYPYFPMLRTRQAELKGLDQLRSEQKQAMLPMLTLGRWPKATDFSKGAEKAAQVMAGAPYCLDLTQDITHLPDVQRRLRSPQHGFKAWRDFVKDWPQALPVLQTHPEASLRDWLQQARGLEQQAGKVAFRITDFEHHPPLVIQALSAMDDPARAIVFIDAQFIRAALPTYVQATLLTINHLRSAFPNLLIVVSSTSFPASVLPFADPSQSAGTIDILERELHARIGGHAVVGYGDHGSIHSVVYDESSAMRWAARVDYPGELSWEFARSPKDHSRQGYIAAAQAIAASDPSLGTRGLWGEDMILQAAQGHPHGVAPVSWIAVRVNLHLARQLSLSQRLLQAVDQTDDDE